MGWGNGMSIGWPNASASAVTPVVMGYFQIMQTCNGDLFDNTTSQLLNTSLYATNDYVFPTGVIDGGGAVRLGSVLLTPGENTLEISGPAYSACPVYYVITSRCDGLEVDKGTTTIAISSDLYYPGDYVDSPSVGTRVFLNDQTNAPGYPLWELAGPAYQSCPPESYNIYNCPGEETLTTDPYPVGSFTLGYRVLINGDDYGYILEALPEQFGGTSIENMNIGFVDNRCNDSSISFNYGFEQQETGIWNLILRGYLFDGLEVSSSSNTMVVTVGYDVYLDSDDGYPGLHYAGTHDFVVSSYNMQLNSNTDLKSDFLFSTPSAGSYYIADASFTFNGISIGNTYGPYDAGWDFPNRFLTLEGNVWTFIS